MKCISTVRHESLAWSRCCLQAQGEEMFDLKTAQPPPSTMEVVKYAL